MYKWRIFVSCASVATVMLLSGCASDGLQAEITELRNTTLEIRATADRASESSSMAMSKAEEALNKAEDAARAAAEAQSCCEDNRERVDRVFKKSMNK